MRQDALSISVYDMAVQRAPLSTARTCRNDVALLCSAATVNTP